jgi:pilus assembly protein Flp/PilA
MIYRPNNEEGQGLVEYALILVLVAVVVIVILSLLGPSHFKHLRKHQRQPPILIVQND